MSGLPKRTSQNIPREVRRCFLRNTHGIWRVLGLQRISKLRSAAMQLFDDTRPVFLLMVLRPGVAVVHPKKRMAL